MVTLEDCSPMTHTLTHFLHPYPPLSASDQTKLAWYPAGLGGMDLRSLCRHFLGFPQAPPCRPPGPRAFTLPSAPRCPRRLHGSDCTHVPPPLSLPSRSRGASVLLAGAQGSAGWHVTGVPRQRYSLTAEDRGLMTKCQASPRRVTCTCALLFILFSKYLAEGGAKPAVRFLP